MFLICCDWGVAIYDVVSIIRQVKPGAVGSAVCGFGFDGKDAGLTVDDYLFGGSVETSRED